MRLPMRVLAISVLAVLLVSLTGCPTDPILPTSTGGGGFIYHAMYYNNGIYYQAGGTTLNWTWAADGVGAVGDPSPFTGVTDPATALGTSTNGRVWAQWTVVWIFSPTVPCFNTPPLPPPFGTITILAPNQVYGVICSTIGLIDAPHALQYTFNPDPLNPAFPPGSVTITGSGFSSTYGMPVVQYFDLNGNLVAQAQGTSLSPDGTTLGLATPNFTELGQGTFAGVINNIASDGSYQYVGVTSVEVPLPFYRPTAYSDSGEAATSTPGGPISGSYLGAYTASVNAFDQWDQDQSGNLYDSLSEWGSCTWSGFPSHIDSNDLTLYVPYATYSIPGDGADYNITATIGGNQIPLYGAFASNSSGVATATVPAGTDISTIQVTVTAYPDNYYNITNPQTVFDSISFDIYVQ